MDINEIADAYSQAVPSRIVAGKILHDVCDETQIQAERLLFKQFILEEFEKDNLEFPSQQIAWEAYNWNVEDWVSEKDYSLEEQENPDNAYWVEHFYEALDEQVKESNYDEFKGQQ